MIAHVDPAGGVARWGDTMETVQRILVVDDDPVVLKLISSILGKSYDTDVAESAAAAKDLLAACAYSLMLTDIQMPGETGEALIRFVRTAFPQTAVVVVSCVSETREAKHLIELGVYGYIVKPFTTHQILIATENALKRRELEMRRELDRKTLETAVNAKTAALATALNDLKQANQEMVELVSGITSIFIGLSPAMTVMQWNKTAEKVFNIPAARVLNRSFWDAPISWDWDPLRQAVERCTTSRLPVDLNDLVIRRPDGGNGFVGLRMTAIESDPEKPTGILVMGADITERKILEAQLTQAQKMEGIGQLAAGIAHEINTPIQYVGDNVRFMKDAFEIFLDVIQAYEKHNASDMRANRFDAASAGAGRVTAASELEYLVEEVPRAIEQTLEGISRISRIVRSMKAFSHPGAEEKIAVDINRALESTVSVSRNEWKYVAEIETDFDPTLPLVSCFPGELNQVFLNIIVNAAHAVEAFRGTSNDEKGCIRITTLNQGDAVEIRIGDTGGGVPEAIRHRIFEPFFTTKEVGKGTGQGLAIAYRIVTKKHQGTIRLETENGKGSVFVIRIPYGNQSR
ncbi:ATP-binding protein [Desulfococcus sp.]|uniref:two-component system sensor histidine kinase NtrB n=1 Tax=Desulfococcus sp. TaxID=2025834 RepID=UPI003D0F7183